LNQFDLTGISQPFVTVFMAVYNGERFIAEAIDSVLAQTFTNFELLIINDGSGDRSEEIIKSYTDSRIRYITTNSNLGLYKTRNLGLQEAKGDYFATLDCDDVAYPTRLQTQVFFLEAHSTFAVVGCKADLIDDKSCLLGTLSVPLGSPGFLRAMMLFSNVFINSSTMIRTEVLKAVKYMPGFEPAEDYDAYQRISDKHNVLNLDLALIAYRSHGMNTSSHKITQRLTSERNIIDRQLVKLGISATQAELTLHHCFIHRDFKKKNISFCQARHWLAKLYLQNEATKLHKENAFKKTLFQQLLVAYRFSLDASFPALVCAPEFALWFDIGYCVNRFFLRWLKNK